MKKLNYREGTWFAVPLKTGGYAVGVVARMAPRGGIVCAYLFGPRREVPPSISELEQLRPGDAIRRLMLGDLGLINGEWPVLGASTDWDRGAWPIPPYLRKNEFSPRAWRVIYAEDDPSKLEREELVPFDTAGIERDGFYGFGAVEILMTKLVGSNNNYKL